jgi:hypothetical protein
MLIGDLPPPGPGGWLQTLKDRIGVAAANGVDTVLLVCDTRHLEDGYEALDALLRLACERAVGVMPRLIVDSSSFTERVPVTMPFAEALPAYANAVQLAGALDRLGEVVTHLETFPNVVGYQVEWGHYGESWVNAPYWDSPSSVLVVLGNQAIGVASLADIGVLAYADFAAASWPVIGRIGNAYAFGLVINAGAPAQRAVCQAALLDVLARMGVPVPPA